MIPLLNSLYFCFVLFHIGSHYLSLAIMELTIENRLPRTQNSQIHWPLTPSAGIKGMCHQTQVILGILIFISYLFFHASVLLWYCP